MWCVVRQHIDHGHFALWIRQYFVNTTLNLCIHWQFVRLYKFILDFLDLHELHRARHWISFIPFTIIVFYVFLQITFFSCTSLNDYVIIYVLNSTFPAKTTKTELKSYQQPVSSIVLFHPHSLLLCLTVSTWSGTTTHSSVFAYWFKIRYQMSSQL